MTKNVKKIIRFLYCLVFCTVVAVGVPQMARAAEEVAIDKTNFPDKIFRGYVRDWLDTDKNGKLAEGEIANVKRIDVYFYKRIESLKGIEHFTALTYLDCSDSQLTNLDVSKNTALTSLKCSHNYQLTSLDVSKNTALTSLDCSYSSLTSLDVNGATALTGLYCADNQLTSLDVSKNTALTSFGCADNQLTSLDVSKNTALTGLYCYCNQLTSLDVSKNTTLTSLDCSYNQLTGLKLHSQIYNSLSLSKNALHGSSTNLSDLQNVTIASNAAIKVTDITKPATYKVDGKDFTIIYVDTVVLPSPVPSTSPVATFDTHIFNDYNYNNPVTGSAVVIYGNGKTQTVDSKKVNNKVFTAYTDILASYKYTVNSKDIVKPSVGKVIVGVTKDSIKPTVNDKNKITSTLASKVAKAKIKNGQITVTAVGKEGGLVYLWVIDTGTKGVSACCPINVKLAPTKLEVQNTSGSKIANNTKLENGKTLDVCVTGLVGSTKTEDGTYTAEVTSKYKDYVTVTPVEGSTNQFTITAKGIKNNKDTKVTITFKCDQNGKKTNLSLTITK